MTDNALFLRVFTYITFKRILARQYLSFIYKYLRLNACSNYDMVKPKNGNKQVFRILIVSAALRAALTAD